jgi:hypothetical protein
MKNVLSFAWTNAKPVLMMFGGISYKYRVCVFDADGEVMPCQFT